jgi:hypothetical protein
MTGNLNRQIANAIVTLETIQSRYNRLRIRSEEYRHLTTCLKYELRHLRLIKKLAKAHYTMKPGNVEEEIGLYDAPHWAPADGPKA